jgi:hypothetical protein
MEASASGNGKLGGGMRALALLLVIVIAVAAVFTGALAVVGADAVQCDDLEAIAEKQLENPGEDVTCYDTGALRVASVALGGIATIILAFGALVALAVVFTGRASYQRLAVRLVVAGVAIGALGYLIAAID